jgi:hypothetical protein
MAFVVARRDGRFEIRESVSTPAGPRARTLAGFRVLSDDVLAEAEARATRPFDRTTVRARAHALHVPQATHAAAATARSLLAQLRSGETLPPALVSELRRVLPARTGAIPDSLDDALEWAGVDDDARGRAARDLLRLSSRFPQRASAGETEFPRIASG